MLYSAILQADNTGNFCSFAKFVFQPNSTRTVYPGSRKCSDILSTWPKEKHLIVNVHFLLKPLFPFWTDIPSTTGDGLYALSLSLA